MENQEVTKKDVIRHYLYSILIYGFILIFITFCPMLNASISNEFFNYITIFAAYYVMYIIFAPIFLLKFKPKTVLQSRSVAIIDYLKRQFKRNITLEERIKNIDPKENEKQAMVIYFMQAFFGVYCLNLLCNNIFSSIAYDISFIKEMHTQTFVITQAPNIFIGIMQYINDTVDMWMKWIFGLMLIIAFFSTVTELDIFKNRIKSVDTTPLGILSCIMCYYPLKAIMEQIIPTYNSVLIPVNGEILRSILNIILILAEFTILLSVIILGTKTSNLTNRGIVTKFPYNIIRHPDYAMQILTVILLNVPIYLTNQIPLWNKCVYFVGILGWIIIYYVRAITEERHLLQDTQYQEYTQKVKYRFIPKLF